MPHKCVFCDEEHFPVSTLLSQKGTAIAYICSICAKQEAALEKQAAGVEDLVAKVSALGEVYGPDWQQIPEKLMGPVTRAKVKTLKQVIAILKAPKPSPTMTETEG